MSARNREPGGDGAYSREELLTLAHELRGALTVIGGYAELLRRPLETDAQATALSGIERAVRRADRLLEDALHSGEPLLRIEPTDLSDLVSGVVDEQRAATGRTIELRVDAHPRVAGDADALSRLLGNLIDNAVKYSLADDPVDVEVAETGEYAIVAVLDRGPGIPAEDRAAAFERFERLGADSGSIQGSGVGLAVVSALAAAHAGSVDIDDRAGGGTRITLRLRRL